MLYLFRFANVSLFGVSFGEQLPRNDEAAICDQQYVFWTAITVNRLIPIETPLSTLYGPSAVSLPVNSPYCVQFPVHNHPRCTVSLCTVSLCTCTVSTVYKLSVFFISQHHPSSRCCSRLQGP